jgi:hypothetical protein
MFMDEANAMLFTAVYHIRQRARFRIYQRQLRGQARPTAGVTGGWGE